MRFAAIADVHGNLLALEAVLKDISDLGITEIVNLGDHLSGPLEPSRTADLLIERGFPSVRGDQDRRLVELCTAGTSTRSDFRQLERKHFDWMASMPQSARARLKPSRLRLAALTPRSSSAGTRTSRELCD
jgi:predicted phosphodiesterase